MNLLQQAQQIDRLFQKIIRAQLHYPHRPIHRAMGSDHDCPRQGIKRLHLRQDLIAAQSRHTLIEQHQLHRLTPKQAQRLRAIAGAQHRITLLFQKALQHLPLQGIVIGYQNSHNSSFAACARPWRGRNRRTSSSPGRGVATVRWPL